MAIHILDGYSGWVTQWIQKMDEICPRWYPASIWYLIFCVADVVGVVAVVVFIHKNRLDVYAQYFFALSYSASGAEAFSDHRLTAQHKV